MAERAGVRVRVGGNLGQPALDLLDRGPTDLYVLELSSFQLDTTHSLKLKAAVVLNVSAGSLDRYATLRHYAESKARIYANSETAVVNARRAGSRAHAARRPRVIIVRSAARKRGLLADDAAGRWRPWLARRGAALLPLAALKISGRHNAANALATLALGDALRLPIAADARGAARLPGLPHRAQWVADIGDVRYINDSKGTNVGATLAAVGGLERAAGGDRRRRRQGPGFHAARRRVPRQGAHRRAARPRCRGSSRPRSPASATPCA